MVNANALRWIQEMVMVTGKAELTGTVADWAWGSWASNLC